MRVAAPAIALAVAQTSVAASLPQLEARQNNVTDCTDVHIFLGKGNNEPYPGRQGKLVNAVCDGLPSCDYEDILFYNPVEAPYCQSVEQGVADGIAQLNAYAARCPNTKLVISGYSQGAQVVGDIIGGGNGTFFQGCTTTPTPALDVNSALGKQIVAVTVFGNTRHTANQPYNQFSGAPDNGIFSRPDYQLANLATWTSKFHDYCVAEDPICAGGDVVADHLNYFDLYSDTAAAWIKSQIASADVVISSTIVSPSSTFTSVATSGKAVPTTYAYTNNTATTNPALTAASSASLSSIQSSVLAIPTVAPESVVTVTVNCASVDTSAIASYTSAWAATATGTQNVGASPTGGSISATTGSATSGSAGSKSSSAANGTHTLMPYTGAASSISGAVSGSLAVVLLGAFALVL